MKNTRVKKIPEMENANVVLLDNFFPIDKSNNYFDVLRKNIKWEQQKMNMYGRVINFARLTSWYGDLGKSYQFSGIKLQPNPWNDIPLLKIIKRELEIETGEIFNSVLLNLYRDGNDSISWHSDQEKELGINPFIASVSFGCKRTFKLRRFDNKKIIHNIELNHGSLLLMSGQTQHFWQHSIPKEKIEEPTLFVNNDFDGIERINLTFRNIINTS